MRQDKVVILEVIHRLMEGLEEEYLKPGTDDERGILVDISVFILASFLETLRRRGDFEIRLGKTMNYCEEAEKNLKHKHVVLPLRGTFKGENGEDYQFFAVSALTNSGLKIGPWGKTCYLFEGLPMRGERLLL